MNDITFKRNLQSVLFDNKYDRFVGNRRSGKLNSKKVSKISFSDKLFKKKEERKNKEYSIALLVDCSGSMDGSRASLAFASAQKLSEHLSSAGVNHCIYGFHAITQPMKNWGTAPDRTIKKKLNHFLDSGGGYWNDNSDDSGVYKYLGPQYIYTGKEIKPVEDSRYGYRTRGPGDNNDAHAVRYVAKELRKQKGTKIMIVLSDGEPVYSPSYFQCAEFPKENMGDNRDLKKSVKEVIKSGIELHSIGIQTEAVNKFYPLNRTCSIYDLPQIYDHIIKIIKLNLKRV